MRRPALLLLPLLAAALSRPAAAVGEDERQLAGAAGGGWLAGAGGPLFRVEGQYGLSDVLALHGAVGASWHGGGDVLATAATAGVTYALDVLRVVPFFEGGLAFLDQRGVAPARTGLGLEAGLGGEYLLDRRWALALVGRLAYLPLRLAGRGDAPTLLALALRLGRTF
jgi:hypothetical protein